MSYLETKVAEALARYATRLKLDELDDGRTLSAICELMLESIGEDDEIPEGKDIGSMGMAAYFQTRNRLRHELRQKWGGK